MSFFGDFGRIKEDSFVEGFIASLLFISPGILAFFHFERDLFIELDFLKLLILSAAFMTPFVLLSVVSRGLTLAARESMFRTFIWGLIGTNTVFYIFLGAAFVFELDFEDFLYWVFGFHIAFFALAWLTIAKRKRK